MLEFKEMDLIPQDGGGPSPTMPRATRIVWIDNARILAMAAVIGIHASASHVMTEPLGSGAWWFAHSYNVLLRWAAPVFIILSGYSVMGSSLIGNPGAFFRHRLSRLLVPFLFWQGFYLLLHIATMLHKHEPPSAGLEMHRLLTGEAYSHLWFAYVIIGLYAAAPILYTLLIAWEKRAILVLIAVMFALTIAQSAFDFGFGLENQHFLPTMFLGYLPYFFFGGLWRIHGLRIPGPAPLAAAMVLAIVLLTFMAAIKFGIESGLYFYDYNNPFVIALSLAVISLLHGLRRPILGGMTATVGANTLGIYFSHPVFMRIIAALVPPNISQSVTFIPTMTIGACILTTAFVLTIIRVPFLRRIV